MGDSSGNVLEMWKWNTCDMNPHKYVFASGLKNGCKLHDTFSIEANGYVVEMIVISVLRKDSWFARSCALFEPMRITND